MIASRKLRMRPVNWNGRLSAGRSGAELLTGGGVEFNGSRDQVAVVVGEVVILKIGFTLSRDKTMIVKTPRTVPNGNRAHWMHAMTKTNQ